MKRSLRTRLFVGALVWMTAVFVTVTALLLKVARNHPELGLDGPAYHVVMGIFVVAFIVGGLFLIGRALAPFPCGWSSGRWPMAAVNPNVLPRTPLERWQPYSMDRGPSR